VAKPIFKQPAWLGLRALLCAGLALLLMGLDLKASWFQHWRAKMDVVALPLQKAVDAPIKWVQLLASMLQHQHDLLIENANLRAHEFILEAKLQKLLQLERENAELKGLLQSADYASNKSQVAQLLAVDLAPELQQVILDKGANYQVEQGQPVTDAYGVMGQVVAVGPLVSKVLLLTDKRSAIPVQNYRNGVRAVAMGGGLSGYLSLAHVTANSDIKVGDLFVTSGLGLRFPVGYPVARVVKYERSPDRDFAKILLKPTAHIDRTEQVLVMHLAKAKLQKAVASALAQTLPNQTREAG
jgi:rod shape-determining protein MreC